MNAVIKNNNKENNSLPLEEDYALAQKTDEFNNQTWESAQQVKHCWRAIWNLEYFIFLFDGMDMFWVNVTM